MPPAPEQAPRWGRATAVLIGAFLLLAALTFRDYGITYDEDWRLTYGEHVVQWYASGFEDESALEYWTLINEGAFFGVCARLLARLSPLDRFETAHLAIALFGALGLWGTYLLGRRLGGPRAGFLATLLLVLTPRFYGHSFNNPIDLPFATLTVLAIHRLLLWLDGLPRLRPGAALAVAVPVGLTLALRAGGVLVLGFVFMGAVLWWLARRERPWTALAGLGLIVVGAYATMLPFWPAAQVAPRWRLEEAWRFATEFRFEFEVFFAGEMLMNHELPRTYVTRWLLISLPGVLLYCLVVGLLRAVRARPRLDVAVVLGTVLVPVGYTLAARPTDYDGMRHFLFVVPPLAALGGLGLSGALASLEPGRLRRCLLVVPLILAVVTLVDMVRLHPYQSIYFNRVVAGGLARAAERYETEYWGASFKEGVAWLVEHAGEREDGRRWRVASALHPTSTAHYLPPERFEYQGSVDHGEAADWRPDWYLAPRRWGRDANYAGEVRHVVERMGVPLLFVKRVAE